MPRKLKTDPVIVEMPATRMAVVRTTGDPNEVGEAVFKALYGTPCRSRWGSKSSRRATYRSARPSSHPRTSSSVRSGKER